MPTRTGAVHAADARRVLTAGLAGAAIVAAAACRAAEEEDARRVLEAAAVKGGLVVHLGCADGRLTAALRAGDAYLVHGLDRDAANVERARESIRARGLYGPVSVARLAGDRLPYIDNLVNLLVVSDGAGISRDEMERVLAPNGVLLAANPRPGIPNLRFVKPRPPEMDEWTHHLHDASNNAVSQDAAVGPPGRLQWVCGPRYSRHHDHMSNSSALVSAGGRVFYVFEESPRASILTPPEWFLYARDAFNGTLLWKRPIERWHPHLWPLKSGPQLLTRRLVASGDRVYATLAMDAALAALDAATGHTVREYPDTRAAEEVLLADGVLFVVVNPEPHEVAYATLQDVRTGRAGVWPDTGPRKVLALEAETGKQLWRHDATILPQTLAVASGRVFYHDGQKIVCLDRRQGKTLWVSAPVLRRTAIRSYFTPTLVVYRDVVLFSGGADGVEEAGGGMSPVFALAADDGRPLWKADQPPCGHFTPKDVLVAGGLVWWGAVAQGAQSGEMTGRDPRTGEIKSQFLPDVKTHWFHHRCYRAKATEKYLLFSRTGVEFIDFEAKHWVPHHWVRGACLYGVMPANGLVYAPPHPCACYLEAKLYGFTVLAPAAKAGPPPREAPPDRLERGPGHGEPAVPPGPAADETADWPTYRGDAARSGAWSGTVPADLNLAWQAGPGGRLTPPVIAQGRLFVASVDAHAVCALDADTGRPLWTFTAGGRVDSPPTVWQGRVLFGCADGAVYCLRASDGRLLWRFRAAPEDRRTVAMEQVESLWPVSGSVLVVGDTLYAVAGRSMFLDGGLRLVRLDPKTGSPLSETVLDDRDPATGANLQSQVKGLNMPPALPDVLSSDGRYVYMRSLPFDLQGRRKTVSYVDLKDRAGDDQHLFSPTGLLDDTQWHRTYWVYGRAFASGAGGYYQAGRVTPAGRLLVFDDARVYGYGRLWRYYRWTTPMEFHLFAASKEPEVVRPGAPAPSKKAAKKGPGLGSLPNTRVAEAWSVGVPIQVNALALAGATLFAAGPPDVVDEEQAVGALADPSTARRLLEQREALEGRRGALLVAVAASDGAKRAAYRLETAPVFDGLAAARGRLYVACADGKVLCLGPGQGQPLEAADLTVIRNPGEAAPKSPRPAK